MAKILIRNTQTRLYTFPGGVRLAPGPNEIDAGDWERVSKMSEAKRLLTKQEGEDKPALELVKASDAKTANAGGSDFASLSETDAVRLVGEATDKAQLTAWSKEAKAPAVKEAIDQRLVEISLTDDERKAAAEKKAKPK